MKVMNTILLEWAYRCPDGIVDINNPEKIKILKEILEEELNPSKESLINLINTSELTPEQIQNLYKYVTKRTQYSSVNKDIQDILTKKGLKRYASPVIVTANNLDIENDLLEYLEDKTKSPLLKESGNLFIEFSTTSGLPATFIEAITQVTSNQIGAGEIALATFIKDAYKVNAKSGQGDIKVGNELLELKGNGAALAEWGSKTPIRDAFKQVYGIEDDKELKGEKWFIKLKNDLKTENKDKAEQVIQLLYPGAEIDLNNLEASITQNYINKYFEGSSVTHILILDEKTGNYKKIPKEDLKNEIGKSVEVSFKKDQSPRITLRGITQESQDPTLEELLNQTAE